jgi:hypothetical protein
VYGCPEGRKLKIKSGYIEMEATEKEVLRICELLQVEADRKKMRDLLSKKAKDSE